MLGGYNVQTKQNKKKQLPLPDQVNFWPSVYMKEISTLLTGSARVSTSVAGKGD